MCEKCDTDVFEELAESLAQAAGDSIEQGADGKDTVAFILGWSISQLRAVGLSEDEVNTLVSETQVENRERLERIREEFLRTEREATDEGEMSN